MTIVDNDVPPVTVSYGASSYTVAEGSSVSVKVKLSADPERTIEVPIVQSPLTERARLTTQEYPPR